jgi:hypothetical protein
MDIRKPKSAEPIRAELEAELQRRNEEVQSIREEMRSLNEELQTVNY